MNRSFFYAACFAFFLQGCFQKQDRIASGISLPISPPFTGIKEAGAQTFEFNAKEGKVLQLPSGSSMVISPNSFVDPKGLPISGLVQLKFKEFHSASDILSSGIPMEFQDEKGEMQHFQSAGMFEIRGQASGQDIFIADGKKLEVNIASNKRGDYDFYYLEKEEKESAMKGTFFPSAMAQSPNSSQEMYKWVKLSQDTDEVEEGEGPSHPFSLHFNTKAFPETSCLDSILWDSYSSTPSSDPFSKENGWVLQKQWNEIEIGKPAFASERKKKPVKNPKNKSIIHSEEGDSVKIEFDDRSKMILPNARILNNYHWREGEDKILYKAWEKTSGDIVKIGILNIKTNQEIIIPLNKDCVKKEKYSRIIDLNKDESKFLMYCSSELSVWDMNGKRLAHTSDFKDHKECWYSSYKDQYILVVSKEGEITIWDWVHNTKIEPPKKDIGWFKEVPYFLMDVLAPSYPVVLLNDKQGGCYLFNWETGKIHKMEARGKLGYLQFMRNSPFLLSYVSSSGPNEELHVYNLEGKWIFKGDESRKEASPFVEMDDPLERKDNPIIYQDTNSIFLIHPEGKTLDLKDKDPLIQNIQVLWNNQLITVSSNNFITNWNYRNGKMERRIPFEMKDRAMAILQTNDHGFLIFYEQNNVQKLDSNGSIIAEFDKNEYFFDWSYDNSNEWRKFYLNSKNEWFGWKVDDSSPLPKSVFRLSAYGDTSEFHTYIHYDSKTWEKIKRYENAKQQRLKRVSEHKSKENQLIRTFEIQKFGIYNWDIFYNKSEVLTLQALIELEGDSVDVKTLDPTLFLITGQDRNAVIKNPSAVWDRFQFNPQDPNLLLMVLPKNRIAIISEEEFKKIDLSEIKKTGKHTFRLRVLNAIQSKDELDKILNANSKATI